MTIRTADPDAERLHELNNLLTVIVSLSELLIDELPEGARSSDAEEILEAARRAATVIATMLRGGRAAPSPQDT